MTKKACIFLLFLLFLNYSRADNLPNATQQLLESANELYKLGKYEQAMELYEKLLITNPGLESAYFNIGLCFQGLGNHNAAISEFSKLLLIKPNDKEIRYTRAYSLFHQGSPDKAIQDLNVAISVDPEYALAYQSRGVIYFQQKNSSLACVDAIKACELGECELFDQLESQCVTTEIP